MSSWCMCVRICFVQIRALLAHVARSVCVSSTDPGIPITQLKTALGAQVRAGVLPVLPLTHTSM